MHKRVKVITTYLSKQYYKDHHNNVRPHKAEIGTPKTISTSLKKITSIQIKNCSKINIYAPLPTENCTQSYVMHKAGCASYTHDNIYVIIIR